MIKFFQKDLLGLEWEDKAMIKMVVSDMDGTLLNKRSEISSGNLEAIHRLEDNHIEFVIASGRDYHGVYNVLDRYGLTCEAILGNGSEYVDKQGNILMSCYMDKALIKPVVSIFSDKNIPYMVFTTKGFFTGAEPMMVRDAFIQRSGRRFGRAREEFEENGKYNFLPCNHLQRVEDFDEFAGRDLQVMKVEAFSDDLEKISMAKEELKNIAGISYLSSFEDNVEVTDQEAQKGYILEKVIKLRGLSKDEVMVTGDGMNDISMFEIFPNSYAPSNAQDEIKKLAGEIVCSSEDDGFAQSVERVLKINMLQWM